MTFKEAYEALRRNTIIRKFPNETEEWVERIWYGSSIKYTKGKSAPGVEKNIVDFIKLSGHQAEKINTMGREIVGKDVKTSLGYIKGKRTFIPTTGTKGSSDIAAVLHSLKLSIEVKLGRDVQSIHQKKYEQAIVSAGGFYILVKDEEDFLVKWNQLLEHPKVILMKEFDKKY